VANDPKVPRKTKPPIKLDSGAGVDRRRPTLDLEQIAEMARIGCTQWEIAGVFRISTRAFEMQLASHPEVRAAWDWGVAERNVSLRRRMFQLAESDERGNVQAAIHLCKHILGETDKAADRKAGVEMPPEFDPSKLDRLTTEEKILFAGFLAKLLGEDAGGARSGSDPSGSLH
jgi:hypothetical protein